MNHDAEEWVEKYWEKGGSECEDCPFKNTWTEEGQRISECMLLESGDAQICPAWENRDEDEDE